MSNYDNFSEEIVSDGSPSIIRKRKNQIKIYLSDTEFARFKDMQFKTSLTGAGLLRRLINEQRIESTVDIKTLNEMRRQGGLFKHNAWSLNKKGIIDNKVVSELVSIANSIHSIVKDIRNDFKKNTKD